MGGRGHLFFGLRAIILAIVVITGGLGRTSPSKADQAAGVSIIIKPIPAKGGTITPSPGIHNFELNTEIALAAAPRPGYRFVCWLGDVSDPEASSTITQVNEPKIIIAFFQSTEYEAMLPKMSSPGGGGSGGAQLHAGGGINGIGNNTSLMGGGGKVGPKIVSPSPEAPLWDLPLPEIPIIIAPVPDEPVVPEPATGTLLLLGSLFAFKWLNGNRLNGKFKY
jgi:hypothetical protein